MSGGELFDRLVDRGPMDERQAATLCRKLASALRYMHKYAAPVAPTPLPGLVSARTSTHPVTCIRPPVCVDFVPCCAGAVWCIAT